ncbi:MAG TPA: cytochrome C oxidase subunit IV family protein [Chloroflexota bacterium]|nr:cytochrome C oxidase subunit IV family protein [Chloroflexota bacterium]
MIESHGGPREGGDIYVGPSVEHGHPTAQKYIAIGVILAVITAIEVAVYYIPEYVPGFAPLLPPILLILSAIKFSLVVMFFMHLKFDSRLFSSFFVGGLLLAGAVLIALLALFHHFFA